MIRVLQGDARTMLATLPAASVQCVVTSPPYFGLRDYGTGTWEGGEASCDHSGVRRNYGNDKQASSSGSSRDPISSTCRYCGAKRVDQQMGNEPTPDAYVAALVGVFREVRSVLRDDGTLWLNLGDSYNNFRSQMGPGQAMHGREDLRGKRAPLDGTRGWSGAKEKDLLMMPARVALALQADGWWLRSDIIWAKPNPMPESVTDRPTSAHEHVFLLTKSARYFYDADAVREEREGVTHSRGTKRSPPIESAGVGHKDWCAYMTRDDELVSRNMRNVWTIATAPYADAHFATFPPELAERCIKAGSRPGDTILDPFAGAFTAPMVADRLQRHAIGIELNPEYCAMARARIEQDAGMFAEVVDG